MQTVRATFVWSGPERDVLDVLVDPPVEDYVAVPFDSESCVFVAVDEEDQRDLAAGAEIVGFLEFDHWDELPDTGVLWRVGDSEPLALEELLKRKQRKLRERLQR